MKIRDLSKLTFEISTILLLIFILAFTILTFQKTQNLQNNAQNIDQKPAESTGIMWSGDVSTGDLSQYATIQQCKTDRTKVIKDPLGLSRNAIQFTVYDTDVAPCTPDGDPRAQALSPNIIKENDEVWAGFSVLVPNDFPAAKATDLSWVSIFSIYGPPFDGAGGQDVAMDTTPGKERFYTPQGWSMPLIKGKWVDFVLHMKLSKDPQVGFDELYVNSGSGWQQQQIQGKSIVYNQTMNKANNGGPNHSKVLLFYRKGIYNEATLYFAEHRLGTSFDSVAPHSYPQISPSTSVPSPKPKPTFFCASHTGCVTPKPSVASVSAAPSVPIASTSPNLSSTPISSTPAVTSYPSAPASTPSGQITATPSSTLSKAPSKSPGTGKEKEAEREGLIEQLLKLISQLLALLQQLLHLK